MSQNQSKTGPTSDSTKDQDKAGNQGDQSQNPPVPLHETPEFKAAVAAEVQRVNEENQKKAAAEAKAAKEAAELEAKRLQDEADAKAAEEADLTKPLYGNQDRKKQFDIRKINPLRALPTDKVILLLRTFYKDPAGIEKEADTLREIQFVNPLDFEAWSKTNESNGLSVYDALGVSYTVLHKPE